MGREGTLQIGRKAGVKITGDGTLLSGKEAGVKMIGDDTLQSGKEAGMWIEMVQYRAGKGQGCRWRRCTPER